MKALHSKYLLRQGQIFRRPVRCFKRGSVCKRLILCRFNGCRYARTCCAFQTACRIAGRLKNRIGSVANLLESLFAVCFNRWQPSIGKKGQ
ncbi:hypothetical protein NEIELOOT_01674 [Neisseria elongata subsp. glycolytica ATCC 29315]|uniref:Uncharacterized protein n=1 Tax=Neisseria elongata subsp. glycolytica ATCC 29315 TaxID=546263 RepID=D4DRI1_NEIEG|nr:hypothetical protein NEIELOOT_01674 [Neisseria elongata subsp. glycolytica ATCC 29315]